MFSHLKQTIYVFCVFWSIHIITTTFTLSDSFDLKFWAGLQTYFLAQNGPFFCPFWPFFGFGWFHHIQRKNGFFFTQITQETLTFHKVSLKSTYYGWGALNEVVICIITLC